MARIERSAAGVVAGPIWIAADGTNVAFPEAGWSDFPVVLLGRWLPSLGRLRDRGQAADCQFMDGPYRFTVASVAPNAWRIACFEGREGPSVSNAVAEWSVDAGAFLHSGLAAARAVLGYCDGRGWWDDDTDRLRAAIAVVDPAAGS